MGYYAIGDIHGQSTMLKVVLDYLRENLKEDDDIVFLGDYIDRGESTKSVLEQLIEFQKEYPKTIFLRGNHEVFFLDALDKEIKVPTKGVAEADEWTLCWLQNGGYKAISEYGYLADWPNIIPQEHIDFIKNTSPEYITEYYHFVHAGVLPPGEVYKDHGEPKYWIREPFLSSTHNFGKLVVFGHTTFATPLVHHNKVGLDTGAVFGGVLSIGYFNHHSMDKEVYFKLIQVDDKGKIKVNYVGE